LLIRIPFTTPCLCKVKPQNGSLCRDKCKVCPQDPRFLQQRVLGVIYFSTNEENWCQCSSGPNAKDNCGNAKPFIGNLHFLSEDSECEWAAITALSQKILLYSTDLLFVCLQLFLCFLFRQPCIIHPLLHYLRSPGFSAELLSNWTLSLLSGW